MSRTRTLSLAILISTAAATTACANTLFSDNFDSYNVGALDKDLSGGANAAPNGSGNPWFGPLPPNLQVINAPQGITPPPTAPPPSGTHMTRGSAPSDFDEDWVNIAYRLNAGQPLTGNIRL